MATTRTTETTVWPNFVYADAPEERRRRVHRAVADQLPEADVDRRAWHLAAAATEPDEAVAVMLEGLGARAAARTAYPVAATALERAAQEETEHLAWTERRIAELGGRKSLLNPLFYAGSLAMGAATGLLGDRWNLGFLAETERQVVEHLDRPGV